MFDDGVRKDLLRDAGRAGCDRDVGSGAEGGRGRDVGSEQ